MTDRFAGPRWPTPLQRDLLRAAVLDRDECAVAWAAWKQRATLDEDIDLASFQLAPMLYRNLERNAIQDEDLGRLKGMYRRNWYLNLQMLHRARAAFSELASADIDTMVLKGISLLVSYYGDYGVRPMADIDMMVRHTDARRAATILEANGWKPVLLPGDTIDWSIDSRHAIPFVGPGSYELDLHWHMLEECCRPDDDLPFWSRSVALSFEGVETRSLASADLLLNVLVHGARYAPDPSIRWLADGATIIRRGGVDWDTLQAEAIRRHLSLPVLNGLIYLRDHLDAGVPQGIVRSLAAAPRTRLERLDYKAQGAAPTIPWALTRDLTRYVRLSTAWPFGERFTRAPRYFRDHYGVESAWHLPSEGIQRIYTRMRATGFRIWRPILPR